MTESGDEGEVVVHDTEVCKLFSLTVTRFYFLFRKLSLLLLLLYRLLWTLWKVICVLTYFVLYNIRLFKFYI